MREELKALLELQHLDNDLRDILSEQEELPEVIEGLKNKANRIYAILQDREKIEKEATVKKDLLRLEIKSSQEKIEKYKEQQKSARNNREYDAFSKQIDHEDYEIKKYEFQIQTIDQEVMNRMEIEEKSKSLISDNRADEIDERDLPTEFLQNLFNKASEESEKKSQDLSKISAETEEEVKVLREKIEAKRSAIIQFGNTALFRYDNLRRREIEDPIVRFERNSCTGCNYIVPKESHGTISRGNFYICESCGRMVISPSIFNEVEKELSTTN
ncbi:MAG: hypothetical protein SFU91_00885 [Chloroherpetonaceae bacterium]|nr:hypothetical protein [Chloroherpetonaceae bacterium]